MDQAGGLVPLGAGQVILANCVNVVVENQNISSCPAAVELGFSSNCNITKNNASNGQYGIYLCRSNDNTIIGNNASSNLYGIYLDYSDRNNILFNEPYDNGYGVYLDFSDENNITSNILYDNAYAIILDRSNWNNITDNNASHNFWGVYIKMSSNGNTVEGNIAYENGNGIQIVNAHWNYILYNNITSNLGTGIYIDDDASWNEITNNNIINNDNGIRIMHFYAENNKFFHNSFIGNNRHAIDMTIDKNEWDNGYPLGGNYWSDYTGVDYFKGPNQDIPGSDGIGDTNYSLDPDSIDYYPLMSPYTFKPLENYTILKQGWNLISIPLIQNKQTLKKVLEMIDGYYDAVQWYDNEDNIDPWKHNKIGKPFGNDLSKINEIIGFWINITQLGDTIFLYNGSQPTVNQTIPLHPGWNLVGYPSIKSHDRTQGLNNLTFDTHVNSIWTYNATTQKWKELGPSDYFELGKGYWIHANQKCIWDVPL